MATTSPEDQIFFVYDHTYLQREEDDLKDAIVYFYPNTINLQRQCSYCGQLMGLVGFFESFIGSPPSVYTLAKNKFAVKRLGKFSLALAGSHMDPNSVIQEQLEYLSNLLTFYQHSLLKIEARMVSKAEMISTMTKIWDCYWPFVRRYGDNMAAAFETVPQVVLPKTCATVFLHASHLLQNRQSEPHILAGCIIFKDKILLSQFDTKLTSKLLLIKPQQSNLPCNKIDLDFACWAGVRVVSVYVTADEYLVLCPRAVLEYHRSRAEAEEAHAEVPPPAPDSRLCPAKVEEMMAEVLEGEEMEGVGGKGDEMEGEVKEKEEEMKGVGEIVDEMEGEGGEEEEKLGENDEGVRKVLEGKQMEGEGEREREKKGVGEKVNEMERKGDEDEEMEAVGGEGEEKAAENEEGVRDIVDPMVEVLEAEGDEAENMEEGNQGNEKDGEKVEGEREGKEVEEKDEVETIMAKEEGDGKIVEEKQEDEGEGKEERNRVTGDKEDRDIGLGQKEEEAVIHKNDKQEEDTVEKKKEEECDIQNSNTKSEGNESAFVSLKSSEQSKSLSTYEENLATQSANDVEYHTDCKTSADLTEELGQAIGCADHDSLASVDNKIDTIQDSKIPIHQSETGDESDIVSEPNTMQTEPGDVQMDMDMDKSAKEPSSSQDSKVDGVQTKLCDTQPDVSKDVQAKEAKSSQDSKMDSVQIDGDVRAKEPVSRQDLAISVTKGSVHSTEDDSSPNMDAQSSLMSHNSNSSDIKSLSSQEGSTERKSSEKSSKQRSFKSSDLFKNVQMAAARGSKAMHRNHPLNIPSEDAKNPVKTTLKKGYDVKKSSPGISPQERTVHNPMGENESASKTPGLEESVDSSVDQHRTMLPLDPEKEITNGTPGFNDNLDGTLNQPKTMLPESSDKHPHSKATDNENTLPLSPDTQPHSSVTDDRNAPRFEESLNPSSNQPKTMLPLPPDARPPPRRPRGGEGERRVATAVDAEGLVELDLYVQAHGDLAILLMMERGKARDKDVLHRTWASNVTELGELDLRLKECQRTTDAQKPKDANEQLGYNYLVSDQFGQTLEGRLSMMGKELRPMSIRENHFCETAVKLHDEFLKHPSLSDITLRHSHGSVYGKSTGVSEVFFQSTEALITPGAPSEKDPTLNIEDRATRKLLKHQGLVLL